VFATDLAYIHDAGFGGFAEGAAPEITRILREHGIRARAGAAVRIVEVGCGSGTLARHLAAAGYEVVGYDVSPAMVRLARAKAPDATFRVRSLTDLRVPACAAIVAIGEVINYVPARASGSDLPPALCGFFERAHEALGPDGLLVFDFIESATHRTYQARTKGGQGWAIAAHAEVESGGRILTRRLVTIRRVGRQYRRSQETHHVRLYERRAVARALADAGFTVRMSRCYGRHRLMAGDVAVIATKIERAATPRR
jgi:2-polyprenyl-3-methyl-5-hydroxy-6-metoxy-1,4-benzoquinol methylase